MEPQQRLGYRRACPAEVHYRYLVPLCYPLLPAVASAMIAALPKNKAGIAARVLLVLLLGSGIYGIRFGRTIHFGGYENYRESRRYITLDARAHPEQKAAMLDNAPHLAAFYREAEMPRYSPDGKYDVVYVFNREFDMHEHKMYDKLFGAGLDDSNMLKIIPGEKIVIFKIFP